MGFPVWLSGDAQRLCTRHVEGLACGDGRFVVCLSTAAAGSR